MPIAPDPARGRSAARTVERVDCAIGPGRARCVKCPGASCGCGDDSGVSGCGDRAAGQLRALLIMPLAPTACSSRADGANGIMRPHPPRMRPAAGAASAGALVTRGTAAPPGNSRPAEGEPFRPRVCADCAIGHGRAGRMKCPVGSVPVPARRLVIEAAYALWRSVVRCRRARHRGVCRVRDRAAEACCPVCLNFTFRQIRHCLRAAPTYRAKRTRTWSSRKRSCSPGAATRIGVTGVTVRRGPERTDRAIDHGRAGRLRNRQAG